MYLSLGSNLTQKVCLAVSPRVYLCVILMSEFFTHSSLDTYKWRPYVNLSDTGVRLSSSLAISVIIFC